MSGSGYTLRTPNTILTSLIQDGQAAGAITPADARDLFTSAMSALPNVQTGSYTLALTDAWTVIEFNNGTTPVSLLVPTDASVNFQIGTVVRWTVLGSGAGVLSIAAQTPLTTTVRSALSNNARAQNSTGTLRKRGANDWVLDGDLAAVTGYFVDSSVGSDTYTGRSPTFIGGTTGPKATIQAAADLTVAGDTVYILPGNGYGGGTGGSPIVNITRSGSAGLPITYSGYQGRPVITTGRGYQTVQIAADYITWTNTEVSGLGNGCTVAGAWSLVYSNTNTSQYSGVGIAVNGVNGGAIRRNVIVSNNVVHDHPANGIGTLYTDYLTINGNTTYNNGFYAPQACSGISAGWAKGVDGVTTVKTFVTNNICYANNNLVANYNASRAVTTANGTSASGQNVLNVASTAGFATGKFIFDTTTTTAITNGTYITSIGSGTLTLSQNLAAQVQNADHIASASLTDGEGIIIDTNNDATTPGPYAGRTLVQNNLCVGNGGGGIYITLSDHCDVNFNTCYNNSQGFQRDAGGVVFGALQLYTSTGSNNTAFNNVVYAPAWGPRLKDDGTNSFGFNVGFGGNGTAMPGSSNIASDPLFVNPTLVSTTWNFQLQSGSPARDASTTSYTRTADITGHALVGSVWDIGAYEFF